MLKISFTCDKCKKEITREFESPFYYEIYAEDKMLENMFHKIETSSGIQYLICDECKVLWEEFREGIKIEVSELKAQKAIEFMG